MSMQAFKDALRAESAAALIFSEENGFYFTGFHSTNAVIFATGTVAVYFTDSRYLEAAKQQIKGFDEILDLQSFTQSVKPVIDKAGAKTILVEGERLSVSRFAEVKKALPDYVLAADRLDAIINNIRAVKTRDEVQNIVRAQRIAEEALDLLRPEIKVGAVEKELALTLDFTMRKLGAEDVSFETILISGKETSKPHGVPSEKKIERGDFVTIDFGALYHGYHSDMTRTFAVGEVSDKMHEIYDTVLNAQLAGLAALQPGKICKEIDAVSRKVIADAGYGDCFGHGLGHSVGVEIHEFPYLNPRCDAKLTIGNVVTVEPGIYIPECCGVRIEDMALITVTGHENLAAYPKELIVL